MNRIDEGLREKSCGFFPATSRLSSKSCQLSSLFRVTRLGALINHYPKRLRRRGLEWETNM